MTQGTSVLLVDDHDVVRFAIRSLLVESCGAGLHVFEAGSMAAALRTFAQHGARISLVILDLNLADAKGLAGLREFKRHHPRSRVVVLSGSVDDAISGEARALGAEQFLHKTQDVRQLGAQLVRLVDGGDAMPARSEPASAAQTKRLSLSPRELEILDLVLQGFSNQEIAQTTGLSLGTVKNYVSGLLVVFAVPSRAKLVSLFH